MFNTLAAGATATQVADLTHFVRHKAKRNNSWSVNNGKVFLSGPINGDEWVTHGRFVVAFDSVTTALFAVNNVFELKGAPERVNGAFDVRSPYLTTLAGGPRRATSYHVEAHALSSLEGAPTSTDMLKVISAGLETLSGLPSTRYKRADFYQCHAVDTTDGIARVEFGMLTLPYHLKTITELPGACNNLGLELRHDEPVKGVSKLFATPGLLDIDFNQSVERETQRLLSKVLVDHDTPRSRRLAAEQLLIDHNLEAFL